MVLTGFGDALAVPDSIFVAEYDHGYYPPTNLDFPRV